MARSGTSPVIAQTQTRLETPGSATHAERADTFPVIAQTPSHPVVVVVAATVELASGVAATTTGPVTAQTTMEVVVVARGASDATAAATWDTSPWLAPTLMEKPKPKQPNTLLLVWGTCSI